MRKRNAPFTQAEAAPIFAFRRQQRAARSLIWYGLLIGKDHFWIEAMEASAVIGGDTITYNIIDGGPVFSRGLPKKDVWPTEFREAEFAETGNIHEISTAVRAGRSRYNAIRFTMPLIGDTDEAEKHKRNDANDHRERYGSAREAAEEIVTQAMRECYTRQGAAIVVRDAAIAAGHAGNRALRSALWRRYYDLQGR